MPGLVPGIRVGAWFDDRQSAAFGAAVIASEAKQSIAERSLAKRKARRRQSVDGFASLAMTVFRLDRKLLPCRKILRVSLK
jgi:hypothetical protein